MLRGRPDADTVAQLVARLRGICEDEHVLTDPHDLRTYQSDGRRTGANLVGTSSDVIAAANPGCVIQIARYLERRIAVLHRMWLLARSLRGKR